ncbi:hypothetical protein GCM10007147_18570 [Nocardiopsis kunsanensis]|uniref:DUF2637 domain-containing protein n=1 Tax=Nocardiopsis kunsanensis TaxID=141693 RepID=A0A919CHQ3_9ACTN|nr:hypothetical protein [Nocardiopsis kunsanensis]GHD23394.1 hypothetical protein GCM10007147_18570 [Nocardiopsis kunsanensis]
MMLPKQESAGSSKEDLRTNLEAKRAKLAAKAEDRITRFRDKAEREKDARAIRQDLTRDRTAANLERAKLAADINQSAEARALRVQRTRTLTLAALLPVLLAFGVWSTAGVHAGIVAMTGAGPYGVMWWALWLLEPALIAIVAWVILSKGRLESSGGSLAEDADHIMWGCLGVSVLLNAVGHWPNELSGTAVGALVAHSLGPIGAAMTAHLIGVIERGITTARPSEGAGVCTLSELTGTAHESAPTTSTESALEEEPVDRSRFAERALEVPSGAVRLPLVQCTRPSPGKAPTAPSQEERRSMPDQAEQAPSKAPAKPRADKGQKVPKSATPSAATPSPRTLSDTDLVGQLDALIASGEMPGDVSVRRVQSALGIGFDRAKRVLAQREERTENVVHSHLSAVDSSAA